jgi:hypothetical protein
MLDNRQTNNRTHSEWYLCDRCGFQYPRAKMLNQNGLNLCNGDNTNNCVDDPGHGAAVIDLDLPYEQRPEPLPWEIVDL